MKKFTLLLVILMLLGLFKLNAQTRNPNQQVDENKEKLLKLSAEFQVKQNQQKAEAISIALQNGWETRKEFDDGKIIEIMKIGKNGMPQYYATQNLNAAKTVNTYNLWTAPYNLNGSGYLIGEWDGGGIRLTHQEFDGRVTQIDAPGATSAHSTHVAGTIVAQGQVANAHGMANAANLNAYDWNTDITEMTGAAASGLTLSNHSYAWNRGWTTSDGITWYWYGDVSLSTTEDYLFGFYDENCEDLDQIANNAPDYLIVWAAANDRNDNHSGGHYYWNGTSWTYSTAYRDPDGGADGYDCLPQSGCAKNVITIGAVEDIPGGWTNPASVVMSSFSSWGPADDGRIKPDIVANGVGVYSCDDDADNDYTTMDGTSMAAPSTTGTLALLQDYYKDFRGGTMSATSLKGLVINTANEAGTANGPDYRFGFGLLNATGAADLIAADDLEGGLIVEGVIKDGQNIYYRYYCDGTSDISVTLCWNDPAHAPITPALNPTTLTLVHDLDLYVIDPSSIYRYPWRLNPASPSSAATNTTYNLRDNVERTDIYSPAAGYYTILIDEFSTLPASGQSYSLIIRGLETEPTLQSYCDARSTYKVEHITNVTMGSINNNSVMSPGGYSNYTGLIEEVTKGGSETITVTIGNYFGLSDVVYAYVDWNQDGDFIDTGESFYLGNTATVTGTINVPVGALGGYTTMRVRMVYGTASPCGTSSYSEAEDYTIRVTTPGLWKGVVSNDWSNPSNWDDGNVPTSTVDVTIPAGCPNYPLLSGSLGINTAAYTYDCKSLTINSSASVTVSGNPVYNYGVLTVAGTLNVGDDFFLYSGSTVNLSGTIQIGNTNGWFGEAYHNSGSIFNQTGGSYYIESIILSDGSQFNGTGGYTRIYVHDFANNNNITINDPDSYFYNFYVESTANAALYNCTYDLQVNFSLNSNGPLNIGSYIVNATYMDIYSALTINSGGTINVTSNGPYFHTAGSLIMSSGGILNSAGNIQFQTGSAENVSGGDIFIEDNFSDYGNIFTPTGGTVTFDASSTSTIYGPTVFYNLIVNKTISDDSGNQNNFIDKVNTVPETYVVDPKSSAYIKNDMMDNTKATIVYLASGNVNALNNVTIQNGELNLSGLQLTIAEDCYVYGTLTMNNSADVLNLGNDFYDWLEFLPGSTANLTAGTIKLYGWIIPRAGSNFTATTGHTVILKGNSGGGPSNFEPTAVYGNIIVDKNAGQIAYIDNLASQPINVSGTFTMNANTIFEMQNETMNVNGVLTDVGTSEIRVYDVTKDGVSPGSSSIKTSSDQNSLSAAPAPVENGTKGGYLEIDIDFTLNGLMDVGDGNVLLHGIFHIASAGNLNITSGSFIADSPLFAKNWEYIDGHLGLTSGLFEISHNSIQFSATGTSTVSGGIIRSGEAFASIYAGNFQPTGGTVEIVGVGSNTIFCDNGNYFYNLLINRDPAASSTFFDNVTINNNLTVNSGILDLFQFTISVYGGVTINGGELDLRNNSTLLLAGGTTLNVNSGGKISLLAGPEPWKVSRISTGYYGFNVQSGGTIAAKNGVFEYMNTNGINLLSGSLVDPAYSFENCTFQNGQAAGTLMTIENNQTFYAEDAVFPTNTWAGAFNVTKAVNAGMVYFVTATGGFAGESYDNDLNNRIMWTNRSLTLKAFMEGPFNGATMNTTLNGILPLSHPFNPALPYFGNPSPDWYYTGAGAVGAIPNVNIVDWTLIEIRDAVNAASATPATSVAKFPAFILNNGNIVSLDGASNLQFSNPIVNNLFVVVYNRNHQGIMNANVIPYSSGSYTYDYTTGAAQVYGGVGGHKELSPGKWGMRSGDGNADGNTNILDKTAVWGLSTQLGKTGYLPSDFNFDRQTNNKDKNDKWVPNLGTGSQVP